MFNLGNVSEAANNGKRLYIYPGVVEVTINGWAKSTNQNGKDLIELELTTVDAMMEGTQNASKKFQFYMTDAAKDASLSKIKHIVTKVTKAEAITKNVASLEEFVALLNTASKGKSLRMKFTGEEYEYNGEIKEAARIGLPAFAEAINEGAEYPAVLAADTKLVYDKTNPRDFKTLVKDATTVTANTSAPANVAW